MLIKLVFSYRCRSMENNPGLVALLCYGGQGRVTANQYKIVLRDQLYPDETHQLTVWFSLNLCNTHNSHRIDQITQHASYNVM